MRGSSRRQSVKSEQSAPTSAPSAPPHLRVPPAKGSRSQSAPPRAGRHQASRRQSVKSE